MERMVMCALVALSGASIGYADNKQDACVRSAFDVHLEGIDQLSKTEQNKNIHKSRINRLNKADR